MTLLLTAGLACVIAAIIGGGLKAWNIEIPTLKSVRRQVVLASFGLLLMVAAGVWKLSDTSQGSKNPSQPAASNQTAPKNEPVPPQGADSSNTQLDTSAAMHEFFLGTWRVDRSAGGATGEHNSITYTADGRFDGTELAVNGFAGQTMHLAGTWQVTRIADKMFRLDEQNADGNPPWTGRFKIIDRNHIQNIDQNYMEERAE